MPELKGLVPAESQEELAAILQKVGEKVKAFFRDFPSTASVEEIRQERLYFYAIKEERQDQTFQYLMLARPENAPTVGLKEYRSDSTGKVVEPRAMLEISSVITKRFASSPIYFHPLHQAGSAFRYLGQQLLEGRETYVVAFAQRLETTRLEAWASDGVKAVRVLAQGVDWIDPTTYQIIRMRTDLLAPRPDIDLERQTTEIRFAEVHFKALPAAFWLPHEVVVTVKIFGQTYRNTHRYSHFRLFKVETLQIPEGKQHSPKESKNPE
jgi:hypothetical protein